MEKKYIALLAAMAVLILGIYGFISKGNSIDNYPKDKDITVIIPKSPGGGTDIAARGLLQYLRGELDGANFVATNKPEGGGVTGMVTASSSEPDGYTLGMVTVELGMYPHQGKCPITYEEFEPICAPIASAASLIVPADAPYDCVEEFAAYCKEHPGEVQVGNSGTGAIWHVAAVAFEKEFGVTLRHVPYPNGTSDIAAALAGNHIDATFADSAGVKSQVAAGNLKILGVMSEDRMLMYPDVPTFKELGYDMTIRAWAALVAPKETTEEVLTTLRDAASSLYDNQEYIDYFLNQGIEPTNIVGEDCYQMMQEDHEMYKELLAGMDLE